MIILAAHWNKFCSTRAVSFRVTVRRTVKAFPLSPALNKLSGAFSQKKMVGKEKSTHLKQMGISTVLIG